jgi:hypothetical protein
LAVFCPVLLEKGEKNTDIVWEGRVLARPHFMFGENHYG